MYLKVPSWILCLVLLAVNTQSQDHDILRLDLNSPLILEQPDSLGFEHAHGILANVSQDNTLTNLFHSLTNPEHLPLNVSDCFIAFKNLTQDFADRQTYAIRVVDSWGRLGSGVLLGNVQWLGRYHECLNIQTSHFIGKYFYLGLGIKSPFPNAPNAAIGICLPDSCTVEDTELLVSPISNYLKTPIHVSSPVQNARYTAVDIIAITITSVLCCLVISGTIYELYLSNKVAADAEYNRIDETQRNLSVCCRLCLSFSIIKNTKAVFDTTQKPGNIGVLHGLRVFSITWIILGHTFTFGAEYVENGMDAARYLVNHGSFQGVANALLSVDSFFFLSGLLAAYIGLKEIKKREGRFSILLPYAYRYLRLTPAYAFCILINVSIYKKFGDGPQWSMTIQNHVDQCEKYWWTNLIYINNLYPFLMNDGCFAWGWYLANDMQFFLLMPFILYLIYRRPLIGTLVLLVGVLGSMIAIGVVSAHYKIQPYALGMGLGFQYRLRQVFRDLQNVISMPDFARNLSDTVASSQMLTSPKSASLGVSQSYIFWADTYARPWTRIGGYFVGVFAGLLMFSYKSKVPMNKIVAVVGWIIAFGTGLSLTYGLYGGILEGKLLPVNVAAFYAAVSRPVWAFCLTWIVVACSSGYGGPIDALLSWKALIPFSRLTYCAYLVHPLILYWVYGSMDRNIHFSVPLMSVIYTGVVFISYAVALAVSLLIEMPMIGITKTLLEELSATRRPGPALPHQQPMENETQELAN